MPQLSPHYANRKPSAIRQAQILFAQRADRTQVQCINLAIGNISLPLHPALCERMLTLREAPGLGAGVVRYSETVGHEEAQSAFLNVIASCDASLDGLRCAVTDGGSAAMELAVLGVCGPRAERPLLLLDPAYTNYMDMARRAAVRTIAVRRLLTDDKRFTPPPWEEIERVIVSERPAGLVIIVADNPTGQYLNQAAIAQFARLCVKHDLWLVSDEAYRQLHYTGEATSSVWRLTERDVPGITGRRISIESASKVFNACGLRMGALVTDNADFHARAVAEYTANLSPNVIGQYIFGALAHAAHHDLVRWYDKQRAYYRAMMTEVADGLEQELPGLIVARPEAAVYSVVDVRNLVGPGFDAAAFVAHCAQEGRVSIDGRDHTLLVSPMAGFYNARTDNDPSRTQMRLAYVEPPEQMHKVPRLFAQLLRAYA